MDDSDFWQIQFSPWPSENALQEQMHLSDQIMNATDALNWLEVKLLSGCEADSSFWARHSRHCRGQKVCHSTIEKTHKLAAEVIEYIKLDFGGYRSLWQSAASGQLQACRRP